ncbi:MAG: hypothetical protein K1X35_00455 [Caulobacteraceae bacterium]|nr:hypothetical protein [Caulobacteraceae bacterium]
MITMGPEERLARAFAFDEPPARDFAFTLAVMEKAARRRLMMNLLLLAAPALVGAVLMWALIPALQPLFESVAQGIWPAVPAALLAAFLAVVSWQLLVPGEH